MDSRMLPCLATAMENWKPSAFLLLNIVQKFLLRHMIERSQENTYYTTA
jgi:hypothetical protein